MCYKASGHGAVVLGEDDFEIGSKKGSKRFWHGCTIMHMDIPQARVKHLGKLSRKMVIKPIELLQNLTRLKKNSNQLCPN